MNEYADFLNRETRSLTAAASQHAIPKPSFRDEVVAQVLEHLKAQRSVLLVGPPGIGKTAVIYGVAHQLAKKKKKKKNSLYQLSASSLLAGTKWLGQWQTKVSALLDGARSGATVYFTDIWSLPFTGMSANDPSNVLDAMRTAISDGHLCLLGEVTPEQLRAMERTPKFVSLFRCIEVAELELDEAKDIVRNKGQDLGHELSPESVGALLDLPRRFSPNRPPPGAALELLQNVHSYADEKSRVGEPTKISPAFIQKVYSIYSGLPLFVVSNETSQTAQEIRAWFRERLIGQADAIDAVVETITLFKAGLNDPNRPLGAFLFVGPTGVGKTELARALATFLFGSAHRMLRFDLSEFGHYNAVSRLVGNVNDVAQPAELLDPVRANPFQVILFDELEKAHSQIWDLLLPLIDDGRLTPPAGKTVDFRNTIVICTSNVGAAESDRSLGFGSEVSQEDRAERIREALQLEFRPEFLNRFQHVVVFRALERPEIRQIARLELERILVRDGITSRNLVVDVQDSAIDHVIDCGYDIRYGARALKRELQSRIVLPLAMTLMERAPTPGSLLTVTKDDSRIRVKIADTPDSRAHVQAQMPVKIDGRKLARPDLEAGIDELTNRQEKLSDLIELDTLRTQRDKLVHERQGQAFWRDHDAATGQLRHLDHLTRTIGRVERLIERTTEIKTALASADNRTALTQLAHRFNQLDDAMGRAHRELVCLGYDGHWDAIVEITPISGDQGTSREFMQTLYERWTKSHNAEWQWLRIPLHVTEPSLVHIQGHFTYGYLKGENGLHRIQGPDGHGAARVRVLPWSDVKPLKRVEFLDSRAIKGTEAYGRRVRSRLECPHGFVLQNERTLAENQDLARELFGCWPQQDTGGGEIVRRYQLEPLHVRDVATGWSSGRTDALSGDAMEALLCLRVDRLTESED